jgi:hypothetical protein
MLEQPEWSYLPLRVMKTNHHRRLEKLSAGGSTAGGAGIELAYITAQENFY